MSVNISLDTAPSRCAVLLLLFSRLGDQHDHLTVTHLVNTLKKIVNTNKQNVLCLNCSSYLSLHYILAEQFRAHSQSPVEALTISLVQSPLQLCHVINPSDRTEDRNQFQDSSFPFVECIKIRHGGAENLPEAAAAAASLQHVCSWRSNKPQARHSAGGQNLKLALLKASVCTDPPSCWIGDEVKLTIRKITKN